MENNKNNKNKLKEKHKETHRKTIKYNEEQPNTIEDQGNTHTKTKQRNTIEN